MLHDVNKENHKLRTHFLILRLLIYECFRIQYSKYQIKKVTAWPTIFTVGHGY